MAGSVIGEGCGLNIDINGTSHEIEFQDFIVKEFKIDPTAKQGTIVLEYDDSDPARINVTFELTSWDELQIQQAAKPQGCLVGGDQRISSDLRQILSQPVQELLAISENDGDLFLDLLTSSERVKTKLSNAKWQERVVVE